MRTFTTKEAAAYLKIDTDTLSQMKDVPKARFGRAYVYIEDDLLAYIRAHYAPQAQGEQEGIECSNSHNEKTARTGGLREQQQTASEYENLLGLKTAERLTSTGRSLKRVSGGKRG